jgi:hypothetical protein
VRHFAASAHFGPDIPPASRSRLWDGMTWTAQPSSMAGSGSTELPDEWSRALLVCSPNPRQGEFSNPYTTCILPPRQGNSYSPEVWT